MLLDMAVCDLLLRAHHIRARGRSFNSHRLVADRNRRGLPTGSAAAGGTRLIRGIATELGHLHALRLTTGVTRSAHCITTSVRIFRSARLASSATLLSSTVLNGN